MLTENEIDTMFTKIVLVAALLVSSLAFGQQAYAAGDAAKGKKVFNRCKACHTLEKGKHRVGPSLLGVVGRKAGTAAGFTRYKGLKGADWVWDEKLLDAYIKNPRKFVKARVKKNTSMVLKTSKAKDRANVIAYLKTKK